MSNCLIFQFNNYYIFSLCTLILGSIILATVSILRYKSKIGPLLAYSLTIIFSIVAGMGWGTLICMLAFLEKDYDKC